MPGLFSRGAGLSDAVLALLSQSDVRALRALATVSETSEAAFGAALIEAALRDLRATHGRHIEATSAHQLAELARRLGRRR